MREIKERGRTRKSEERRQSEGRRKKNLQTIRNAYSTAVPELVVRDI